MLKKIAFTVYPVENLPRARHFYEELLGLKVSKISANGSWIEYDLPEGGCFALTSLAEDLKPSSEFGGSVAFEVDDLDTIVDKLKAANIKFKFDIMASPVCRMAVIIDSEGNNIVLHQLRAGILSSKQK